MLEAGDLRLQESLEATCAAAGTPLLRRPDPHFLCNSDDFFAWAGSTACAWSISIAGNGSGTIS